MNVKFGGLSVLVLFFLVGTTPVEAAEWSLKDLNPFASKNNKAKTSIHRVARTTISDPLAKLNAGTKKFFSDAVDLVTLKPITKTVTKASYSWERSSKTEKSRAPFFKSWFAPTESKKRPETVNEWMRQDSVGM